MHRPISIVLLIFWMGTFALGQQARTQAATSRSREEAVRILDESSTQLGQLDQIYARTVAIHRRLSELYQELSKQAAEVGKLAEKMGADKSASSETRQQLLDATRQMQQTQMSFNLQFLQLQNQMQNENRQYTAVSAAMKAKHDTVKNSIRNVR